MTNLREKSCKTTDKIMAGEATVGSPLFSNQLSE